MSRICFGKQLTIQKQTAQLNEIKGVMVKNAHERIRYVLTKGIVSISQEAASAMGGLACDGFASSAILTAC